MKKFVLVSIFALLSAVLNAQQMKIFGFSPETRSYSCYLGIMNVGEESTESIWNVKGEYGDSTSVLSIWNEKGDYGSVISEYSPFNEDAKYPPVIKDDEGTEYGFFTIDLNCRNRCEYDLLNVICQYHEKIAVNVKLWHDKIFR